MARNGRIFPAITSCPSCLVPALPALPECNMRSMRRLLMLGTALAIAGALAWITLPYVHGVSFVVRAANMDGVVRHAADLDTRATSQRELEIPLAGGPLRARLYEPVRGARRTALLVSGLHSSGIDEPRH